MSRRRVLVTGGCGYVGSVVCSRLALNGFDVVALDNFSFSRKETSQWLLKTMPSIQVIESDICDALAIRDVLSSTQFFAVVHLAAIKSMEQSNTSLEKEMSATNVNASHRLFKLASSLGVARFVFASSAAVYGLTSRVPTMENAPCKPNSEYGRQKLRAEALLIDAGNEGLLKPAILRLFNVAGADTNVMLGERTDLGRAGVIGRMLLAHSNKNRFTIYGTNYDTTDGTAVRDYVHVLDVASAVERAIVGIEQGANCGPVNIGSARGTSVRELISAVERQVAGRLAVTIHDARSCDVAWSVSNIATARTRLGWEPTRGLGECLADAFAFYQYSASDEPEIR